MHSSSPITPLLPRHLTINAPVTRQGVLRKKLPVAINHQLAASQRRNSEESAAYSPKRNFSMVSPTDQLMIDNTNFLADACRRNSQQPMIVQKVVATRRAGAGLP